MLKIFKIVGEEPIVAEVVKRNPDGSLIVENPLIPRMRSMVREDGTSCSGLGWSSLVQFTENLEETMRNVIIPPNTLMWEDSPTGEVCDSYFAAMEQIRSVLRNGYDPEINKNCRISTKIN